MRVVHLPTDADCLKLNGQNLNRLNCAVIMYPSLCSSPKIACGCLLGNKRKHLRTHAKLIALLIVIVVLLVGFVFFQSMFVKSETISTEGIREYVQEYFSEYRYIYDGQNVPWDLQITDLSNFTFGLRNFDTTAVISTTHGAALFFSPSEKGYSEITTKEISYPIEYYLWPQMTKNIDVLPSVEIKPGDYLIDGVITVHDALMYVDPGANIRCVLKDRPFNVTSTGAVMIFGSYILEHSILLKGSNAKEDWSRTQADIDALSEYLYDCKSIGMNDTAVKNIETKYKPFMLLDRIASRMKSGVYKDNQALFNSDYEELRRVAADTMNDMLTKVLNDYYALQQESPPSFFKQIVNYLTQKADAIIIGVLIAVIGAVAKDRIKSKQPETKKRGK
jgi:hypothetical protein